MEILSALAACLSVAEDRFTKLCEDDVSSVRLNYYPECNISTLKKGTKRISEHCDTGDLTLLFQDSVGGLEIENQNAPGTFTAVPNAIGPEMIVNIGDSLQRWTNDVLRSTCHRVVLPPSLTDATEGRVDERHSVAFFGKPNREASVGSMTEFTDTKTPAKYKDVSIWDYQLGKYQALFEQKIRLIQPEV
jgi:isopenicillin N synthase-like dioxygenase